MTNINYEIIGSDLQVIQANLAPGQSMIAEAGAMVYMDADVRMSTAASGGLFQSLKRSMAGGGFFVSEFAHQGESDVAKVAFSAPYPGKIMPVHLDKLAGGFICQKDAFLCAESGTEIDIAFTKRLGAGFFGGDGFILQSLRGSGVAFVHAGGALIKHKLAPGEIMRVETGALVGFTEGVDYNIEFVGGFKNTLFGGEGLFLSSVRGPGTVVMQSLPIARLADRLSQSILADHRR